MQKITSHIAFFISLISVCFCGGLNAQSLDHQTINSGSAVLQSATGKLSVTTGQVIIGVGESVNLKVTQGFNQPDCDLNLDLGPIPKVCENGAPIQLYASIPSGVFSGPGVIGNTIHPDLAGAGTHQIAYRIDLNGCKDSAFATYTLKPKPTVAFVINDTVCKSGIYQLDQGFPSGGLYTGLGVQPSGPGFVFRPNLAGLGTHPIQYTYSDTNGCSASDTGAYIVIPNPAVSLNIPNTLVCHDVDSVVLTGGNPAGGFFTGNGVNTINNTFYPDSAAYGNQVITYNYLDTNNGCSGSAFAALLNDTLPNNLSINFPQVICSGQPAGFINAAQPLGGQYFGVSQGLSLGGYLNPNLIPPNTYQVGYAYTTNFGCSDTVYDQLTITAPQKPQLANIPQLCNSDSITPLTGGNPLGGTYSGLNIANNQIDPSKFSAGVFNYFYEITDSNNCIGRDTASITVINPIQINLNLPGNICDNVNPINLNQASSFGSGQYLGLGVQDSLFSPFTVGVGNTTKIHIFGLDSNNCASRDSAYVSILASTPVNFTMAGVCNNLNRIKLKGGQPSGGTYSGSFVDSVGYFYPSQAQTNSDIIYSYSNIQGCVSADTFNLTLFQVQKPIITEVPAICENDSDLALTANILGGKFSGNGVSQGFLHPNQITSSSASYYYAITDNNGCAAKDTSTINILPAPTISQNLKTNICEGEIATFELNEDKIYLWSDGHIGPSHQLSPNTTSEFSVTVSDGFCASVDSFTIQVNPKPSFSLTTQKPNCGMENGKIFVTASGATGPYEYNWSSGHFGTSVATNLSAGVYELSITDAYGCNTVKTYALSDNNAPSIPSPNINGLNCNDDDNASIALNINNPSLYEFSWLRGDTSLTINNLVAGSYFFTLKENSNGCTAVEEFRIENPQPIAIQPLIIPNTCGNTQGRISLNTSGGTGGYNFAWSSGETSDLIQNKTSGAYTVTVSDANNCSVVKDYFIPNGDKLFVQLDSLLPPDCAANNGAVALKTLGPNYTVVWGGTDTSYGLQNIPGGFYPVEVYDGACTVSLPFVLNNLKPLQPELCNVSIDTSSAQAVVVWQGNGENQMLYRRGIEEGAYQLVYSDSSNNQITYVDNEYINSSVPLTYKVITENQCGDLSYDDDYLSSIFLSAIRIDGDKVRLKWTEERQDPSSIIQYNVYGKQQGGTFNLISTVTPPKTFYELDSLGQYTAFLIHADVNYCGNQNIMFSNVTTRISFDPNLYREEVVESDRLLVFPNPAVNLTNLLFEKPPKGEVLVTLFGSSGQVILRTNFKAIAGQRRFELPLENLASGSYSLKVEYENTVENRKLLIN